MLSLRLLFLELLQDLLDFHLRNSIELRFENGIDLNFIELESLHQLLGRIGLAFAIANNADGFIERVENNLEAFENVNSFAELFELILKTALDRRKAKIKEVAENLFDSESLRARCAMRSWYQTGHVVGEILLQSGVF